MATPTGALRQTLEQEIVNLNRQVRDLTAATLRRRQLGVTEGDFVVSGGGSVIVQDGGGVTVNDGGSLRTEYTNGQEAVRIGPIVPSAFYDHGFLMFDEDGTPKVWFSELQDGRFTCQVRGDAVTIYSDGDATLGSTGELHLGEGASAVYIGYGSTGASANTVIDLAGRVNKSTSSLRYKQDVEDHDVDPAAVLQMRPRSWRGKADVDELGEDAPRWVGFIAEELADLGLTEFVVYDAEGRPDAIAYDRLSVALLSLAKAQQTRLDDLAERLEALEAKA